MLEIISLFVITWKIGLQAANKGLEPRKWKIYTIILFFILEIAGCCFSLLIFSRNNIISIGLLTFAFGITSYPIIKEYIAKLPDVKQEEN